MPRLLNGFYATVISTERIEKFLKQEEVNPNNIIKNYLNNKCVIKIENGNFSWGIQPSEENGANLKKIDEPKNINKNKEKKYKEIELVEKIYIPEDNETNKNNSNNNKYLKLEQKDSLNGNKKENEIILFQ